MYFSVHTITTIGYGMIYPANQYANIVVVFEAWMGLLSLGLLVGVVVQKVSRPSRLRHTVKFSKVAVINQSQYHFSGDTLSTMAGDYKKDGSVCLTMRVVNLRKRTLCQPLFHVLLIQKSNRWFGGIFLISF